MIRFLLAALILCCAVQPAAAHQQKRAISTIAINPRTDRLEITHQVPVHDAEHALRLRGDRSPDIVGDHESQRAFARYIADRFELMIDGAPAAADFVGSEIEGGSLWIYQEADVPPQGASVMVNSQILTDIWTRQENRVNVGLGTDVHTIIFHRGDGPQAVFLP